MKKELKIICLVFSLLCSVGLVFTAVACGIQGILELQKGNLLEFGKYTVILSCAIVAVTLLVIFNVFNFLKPSKTQSEEQQKL